MNRDQKRQQLETEHKAAKAKLRRVQLKLSRTFPKLDAVGVQMLRKEVDEAAAEFKKLDSRVNRGGAHQRGRSTDCDVQVRVA